MSPVHEKKTFLYLLRKSWHLFFGGLAIVVAFIILLFYTPSGEELWIKILQSAYDAFSLILLEGNSFNFPQDTPRTILIILWICYFAAPLLTLTFIIRYFQERLTNRIPRNLKNHIIICGLGRNGKIIYDLAKKEFAGKKIVIIEKNESNSYGDKLEKDSKTWWIKKDFREIPALEKAGIATAHKVYITTNDDLANITTLMNAVERASAFCDINCHVGDVSLYTNIEKVIKKVEGFAKVKLFNGYQMATQNLFKNKVEAENYDTENGNVYVFFGFGRFGNMLYNYIIESKFDSNRDQIIIVTLNNLLLKDHRNYTWTGKDSLNSSNLESYFGDMNDVRIWDQISEKLAKDNRSISIFSCRDNDIANINFAISLMNNGPGKLKEGVVFCRTYSETPVKLQQILEQGITEENSKDVILLPVYKELKEAFGGRLFL